MILHGDSLEVLKTIDADSVDAVMTDPPYGLSFMGKKWDYDVPSKELWAEVLRVLKPGGHLLSFGGTRTYHRMVCAIEDAGFEIRDCIFWHFGSGFPKSLNVYKAAQKAGLVCECAVNLPYVCSQEMPSMQNKLDAENSVPGDTQSDVLESVHKQAEFSQNDGQIQDAAVHLSSLQSGLSSEVAQSAQDMLVQVQGHSQTIAPGNLGAPSLNSAEHEGTNTRRSLRREKSSVEGRSDVQAEQGQLYRPEVRPLSEGILGDGAQGRLCDGTSASDGETSQAHTNENGSCASQGPQHKKQSHFKSGTISEQSGPQTCRGCGKAIIDKGLGTALKPATEPIVLARKPLSESTVAKNVLKHGCGALNIDGSRIGFSESENIDFTKVQDGNIYGGNGIYGEAEQKQTTPLFKPNGRWPANVLFDESAAEMLDEQSGDCKAKRGKDSSGTSIYGSSIKTAQATTPNDSGGASRFFYVAKASKRERNAGLEGMPERITGAFDGNVDHEHGNRKIGASPDKPTAKAQNHHPTVKPIKLMEYLCKLITPPGGTILDPFCGSGSTGVAAVGLGFKFIGIEREAEYVTIANKRIEHARPEQMDLSV